jgi:hypothetical protein
MQRLAIPFLFAILVRVVLLVSFEVAPTWDGAIYARAADDIARGSGLTRHALSPTQPLVPTAFYPVGLPAALAPLRWLGLERRGDVFAQCVFGALLVPISGLLARRALGRRAGVLAAWLVALWPGGVLLSLSWLTEPLFSVLVGLASVVLAWSRRRTRLRALGATSLLLALAAYVRPTALPILGLVLVGVVWIDRHSMTPRACAGPFAVGLAVATLVLAPWSVRNAVTIGSPVPIATNGGFNLLLGSYGEGRYQPLSAAMDCPGELGEVAKDRCRFARAWTRIAARPGDALARSLLRLTHTFGHESAAPEVWAASIDADADMRESARLWALGVCRLYWLALLSVALAGGALFAAFRRADVVTVALGAPVLGTLLMHTAIIGGDRYHAQTIPMLATYAALAIARWIRIHAAQHAPTRRDRSFG